MIRKWTKEWDECDGWIIEDEYFNQVIIPFADNTDEDEENMNATADYVFNALAGKDPAVVEEALEFVKWAVEHSICVGTHNKARAILERMEG